MISRLLTFKLIFFSAFALLLANAQAAHSIETSSFGKTKDGASLKLFTLKNRNGMIAKVTNYGATLTELWVPDKSGKLADVVLGFDKISDYEKNSPYFGAIIGRYANRIANGECVIDGVRYSFTKNDRQASTLHGGLKGFDKRIWHAENHENEANSIKFEYTSVDMEEGFPGTVKAEVQYTLTDDNAVKIEYQAVADKTTIINLTNHSYFNLSGTDSNILDHILTINADRYTPVNEKLIPLGRIDSVEGTAFDFRKPMSIGERIDLVKPGYDINYVLNKEGPIQAAAQAAATESLPVTLAATALDPKSGRKMEVYTSEPGLQLYTGQWLDVPVDGITGPYKKYDGFCMEAQHFPDSPNHPDFPSVVYKPGQAYRQVTVYKFVAE